MNDVDVDYDVANVGNFVDDNDDLNNDVVHNDDVDINDLKNDVVHNDDVDNNDLNNDDVDQESCERQRKTGENAAQAC